MTTLEDVEAALRLAKEQGKSKMELHLFVVAKLLAERREAMAITGIERDAQQFMRGRK